MPLKLIHGPPNSGRAGRIRRALIEVLDRDPVLVVPTVDDVYSFERELCASGAVLGAAVMTFGGLFRTVATAGGSPPAATLTPAQRLGAVGAAVDGRAPACARCGRSASQPGSHAPWSAFWKSFRRPGSGPPMSMPPPRHWRDRPTSVTSRRSSPAMRRFATGSASSTSTRSPVRPSRLLEAGGEWWRRPVFVYGFDDLTGNQLDLLRGLAAAAEVTVALPYEEGNPALEQRSRRCWRP